MQRAVRAHMQAHAQPEASTLRCGRHDKHFGIQIGHRELDEERQEHGTVALLAVRSRGCKDGNLEHIRCSVQLKDCGGDDAPAAIEHDASALRELACEIDRSVVDLDFALRTSITGT